MKMSKKSKIMICCLVLVAAVVVAAVLLLNKPKTDTAQDALAKIKAKGTLVIGTEGNWSPWTYHDEQDNLTGFDVEIARLLAKELGVKAEFQEAPWDALLAGVDSDRFDIICNGVGYTEERAKSYSFTDPYCYSADYLAQHPDAKIKVVQTLAGDPVAYPVKLGEQTLVDELNRILAKLRDEGKLSELSMRFFDVDTTKAE